jgi:thiosulfate reductase cytochrome b subunit
MAGILGINAFLAFFYHLSSGEIKQFVPRPYGFFDQAITQAKYYLQGIFNHAPHPFEKSPERKLNPLQQITYLMILNALLPLQGITGVLIWGAQRWPRISEALGGLGFLSPLHTFIAWLFAAFIIMHVYLTTTGEKPLAAINAMMMGWENVELHDSDTSDLQDDQEFPNDLSQMKEMV